MLRRSDTAALVGHASAGLQTDGLREQLARDQLSLPTNFLDLMMWAVLAGQPALATELWGRTREPLRAARLAPSNPNPSPSPIALALALAL